MNKVGQQFGVSYFTQDALQERHKLYQEAVKADQTQADQNTSPEKVEFSFEGVTTQVIIDEAADSAMARQVDSKGVTLGIETLGESMEVATRTYDGFAAQTATVADGGDGWYAPVAFQVKDAPDAQAAFQTLDAQFSEKWEIVS